MTSKALIVVDMQNDFLPGGSMGIKDADKLVPTINHLLQLPFDVRVASLDWHPAGHCSFASTWGRQPLECIELDGIEQKLWPDHCVQRTKGSEFTTGLNVSVCDHIVHKGTDLTIDSYSTFYDNQKLRSTGLEDYLKKLEVTDLYFAGVCTEYCVIYSVIDAMELGFRCHVIHDACMGIDTLDVERALCAMKSLGVDIVSAKSIEEAFS